LTARVACSKAEYRNEDHPILLADPDGTETLMTIMSIVIIGHRYLEKPQAITATEQLSEAQYRQFAATIQGVRKSRGE
jgi:hypothetical protein